MVAHNVVQIVRQNAHIMRIVLSALPGMSADARRKYLEQTPFFALSMLEAFISAQMKAGVFRSGLNPAIVARTFPGMLLVFLMLQEVIIVDEPIEVDYDEIIDHVVGIFLLGVRVEAPVRGTASRTASKAPRRKQGKPR